MATTLDELLVGLGFDYDPDDLEQFNNDMESTVNTVKSLAKALIAGTAALIGFTAVTTAATDKQGKLSNQTGVSVEKIDALEFALKRAGGEGSSLGNNLEQLSIRLSEASRGIGSGVEAFGILGISVTDASGKLKDTDEVLLEVSDSLQKFSKAQQIELADKLGLRDSILLLQEGSEGIEALTKEAEAFGVTTKEDALLSAEFQDSLVDIFQIVKQLSRLITRSLAPIMENLTNDFTEWWKANKDLIQQNIAKYIDTVTVGLKLLTLASALFIGVKLATTLISLIKLFKGLSVAALLANVTIAAIPLLIGAGIAAIALLAEDAKVFFEGGESFLGNMIEKFPLWANEIRVVAAVFATVAEMTGMIVDGWIGLFNLFSSDTFVADFKRNIGQVGIDIEEVFESSVESISTFFDELWSSVSNKFQSNIVEPIRNSINNILDMIPSFELPSIFGGDSDIDISNAFGDLPVINDIKLIVDDLPVINDIKLIVDDLPVINDIKLIVDDLPNLTLDVDDIPVLNGLVSDQNNTGLNSVENISKDNSLTNTNKPQLTIGDIKVNVTSNESNPAETGRIVAISIREQLEPILQQASVDLNSAVEL